MTPRETPPQKRAWPSRVYKASDLPLAAEQKEAVVALSQTFKKQGDYDSLRKGVLESFEAGVRTKERGEWPL
jgi:hypothetical protein